MSNIDRQAAIDAIVAWTVEDRPDIEMPTDLIDRIKNLTSAQPEEPKQAKNGFMACSDSENTHDRTTDDLISRQAAIEALAMSQKTGHMKCGDMKAVFEVLSDMPSVQADVPDTNVGDTVSRQAAIDAVHWWYKHMWGEDAEMDICESLEELPSAEPDQHWIPCSERLPDNEKRVLCTVQSGEHFCVVPCIFIQHTRRWLPEVYGNHDNVIAWMPLPEPYKADMRGEEDGGI